MTKSCCEELPSCNESVHEDQRPSCVEWVPGSQILVDDDEQP